MAISHVGSTSYNTGASSNVAQPIALPAGSAVDDLALLVYTQERATVPAIPAGWSTIYAIESTTTPMATLMLYKKLTADDILAGSVTVGPSATRRFATAMTVLRGAGTPTWANKALVVDGASTTTVIGPDHTAAAATGWLVALTGFTARATPWVYSLTSGAGWTERVEATSTATTAVNGLSHIATKPVTASGAQTGQSATASNGNSAYFASTLYVPEAATGGGTPTDPPPASGTVTFVAKSEASTGGTSAVSLTCPLPTGAAVDQLALVVFGHERGAAGAAVPQGWTAIENASDTTLLTSIKAYKHLTPADLAAGSVTFTTTATRRMAAAIAVFAGAGVPTWASSGYTTSGASTTTATHPPVTATAATGLVVSATVLRSALDPWVRTWAPEADWTERVDVGTTVTTAANPYVNIATQAVALAGSQPGHVVTGSDPQFGYFPTSLYVPVGTAPAGAGETQIVAAGTQVVLRGTGTGSETWAQTGSTPAGITVPLGGDTQNATFIAPVLLDDATLTFARGTGTATVIVRRARSRRLVSVNPPVWRPIYEERVTQVETNPPVESPQTVTLLALADVTLIQVPGTRQVEMKGTDPNNPKGDYYIVTEDLHGNLNTTVPTPFRRSVDLEPGNYRYTMAPAYTSGATGTGVTKTITVTSVSGAPTVTPGTPTIGTKTWSVAQTADVAVTAVGQLRLVVDGPVVATYTLTTAATSFTESYTGLQPGTQYIRTTTFTRADTGVSATQSGAFTTQQATATLKYERLGPTLLADTDPIPVGWPDYDKIRVLSDTTYTVNDGPTRGHTGTIKIAAGRSAIVLLPRNIAVGRNSGGLSIDDGVNVAIRGGEAKRDDLWTDAQYYETNNVILRQTDRKAMQVRNFAGHLEAEGVLIHGHQILDCLWVNTNLNSYSTGPTKRYMTFQNCLFTESHAPTLDSQKGLGTWTDNELHADGIMFIGGEPTQPDGTTIAARTVVRMYQCMVEGSLQGIIGSTYGFGIELEMERTHFNMTEFNSDGSREPAYPIYWGGGAVRIGPEVTVRHARAGWTGTGYPAGAKWAGITLTTGERIDPAWKATAWTGTRIPGRGYVAD